MNNTTAAWKWRDGEDEVTATWQLGGWPLDPTRPDGTKQLCKYKHARRSLGLPPCRLPGEWQIVRRRGGHAESSWYCNRDLPSTEAPPVDAERIEP